MARWTDGVRAWFTTASCAAALAMAALAAGQSAPVPSEGTRALAVRFANGRTVPILVRSTTGGFWTTLFPHAAGATTAREGLPLSAVDIAYTAEGLDLTVKVSLLYGSPHQKRVEVATVKVTGAEAVTVDQLKGFGVDPITLSIVTAPLGALYPPAVTCVSGLLDLTVEPVAAGVPAYRVVAVNRGTHALIAFDLKAYRGDREALSGGRRLPRLQPLLEPGAQTSFELRVNPAATSGREGVQTPEPYDRIAVTGVLWDDGTVEGDPTLAVSERMLADGNRRQIARVLGILRAARDPTPALTPADLRARVWALPVAVSAADVAAEQSALADARLLPAFTTLARPEDSARAEAAVMSRARVALVGGMQQVKDAALVDIDEFVRGAGGGDPVAFRQWLATMITDYETWLARAARWTVSPM